MKATEAQGAAPAVLAWSLPGFVLRLAGVAN